MSSATNRADEISELLGAERLGELGNMKPRHIETLADGTWLAELRPAANAGRKVAPLTNPGDRLSTRRRPNQCDAVQVVHHTPRPGRSTRGRSRCCRRAEVGDGEHLRRTQTHRGGAHIVLRSKSPELVLKEIWGHLCCHCAIRTLLWKAADHAKVDPDRVSFVVALASIHRLVGCEVMRVSA